MKGEWTRTRHQWTRDVGMNISLVIRDKSGIEWFGGCYYGDELVDSCSVDTYEEARKMMERSAEILIDAFDRMHEAKKETTWGES